MSIPYLEYPTLKPTPYTSQEEIVIVQTKNSFWQVNMKTTQKHEFMRVNILSTLDNRDRDREQQRESAARAEQGAAEACSEGRSGVGRNGSTQWGQKRTSAQRKRAVGARADHGAAEAHSGQMKSGNEFACKGVMREQGSVPDSGPNHHLDGRAPSGKGDSSPC